jgi:hypothetical protein
MHRYFQSEKSIPVLFALITVLAYGLLLPYTGFHWDDWGFAWIAKFLGPAEFIPAFSGFRPFLGPIFFVTTSLVPPDPFYWQLFALLIRFVIALSTWWTFKSIWPERPRLALTVALFVLIFPGYSQHWVALTHINQELIPFIFYLLSFGVTAHAIRSRRTGLTVLALLLQFGGLFPTEYFFGLEPLRFLFIWFMPGEKEFRPRLRRAFLFWLPHLLLWLANAAWLVTLYRSDAYVSYGISASQDLNLPGFLTALGDALFKAGLYAWTQILILTASTLPAPASLLTLGLVAVTFTLLTLFVSRLNLPTENSLPSFLLPLLLLGLTGILLGRLPSLAAGLPLTLQSTFDRFMISMTLGGSLFLAGLIEWLFQKNERARTMLICLVVALGVGQQFFNANLFRRDWTRQQEIYWQFAWRIPALQPGTLILTDKIPDMPFETDLSFSAPINWIYAPDYIRGPLPYALLYTEARLGGGTLPELKADMPVTVPFRTVSFQGSTAAGLTIFVPAQGCLRVLDPALGDAETYEKESRFLLDAIPYSDPSRILLDSSSPILPDPPFSREPQRTWCYYYEKAELARQAQDWEAIVALGREANRSGYQPEDVFEWLPFIEAYAHTGEVDKAIELSRDSFEDAARVRKGLCRVWERVQVQAPSGSDAQSAARHMLGEFNCTP